MLVIFRSCAIGLIIPLILFITNVYSLLESFAQAVATGRGFEMGGIGRAGEGVDLGA